MSTSPWVIGTLAAFALAGCIGRVPGQITSKAAATARPAPTAARNAAPAKNPNTRLAPTAATPEQVVQRTSGAKASSLPARPGFKRLQLGTGAGPGLRLLGLGGVVGTGGPSPARVAAIARRYGTDQAVLDVAGAARYVLAAPPATVDLRDRMPPVRNQGARGTCGFFATAAVLDAMYADDPHMPIKHASPQFMAWLDHMEIDSRIDPETGDLAAAEGYPWGDYGMSGALFFPLMTAEGHPDKPFTPPAQGYMSEEDCPYQETIPTFPAGYDLVRAAVVQLGEATTERLVESGPVLTQGADFKPIESNPDAFEAALAGGQPVLVGVPVYGPDWAGPDAAGGYHIAEMTDAKAQDKVNLAYHEVALVGYRQDAHAPGGGYYLLRNSWGSGWGDHGYAWVSYAFVHDYVTESYVAWPYDEPFDAYIALTFPPVEPYAPRGDAGASGAGSPAPDASPTPAASHTP